MLAVPVLLTLGLGVAMWPWTVYYDRRPTVRLLAVLLCVSAFIVVSQVLLGSLRLLSPGPLISLVVLTIAVSAALYWAARERRARAGSPPIQAVRPAPPTALGFGLGVLTVAVYLWQLNVGSLVPPYGWDTLSYHMTDVFHAAQSRSLELFGDPGYPFYYPQAGEVHSLWFYLLSGGGDQAWRVIGVGLIPLALTAGVAARAVAEALGLRVGLPWIIPGVMLAPIVVIEPLSGNVDVVFAAFVLAAFAFATLAAVEGRFAHVALFALATGLAFGVKSAAIYYSVPAVLMFAAPRAWRWFKESRWLLRVARAGLCLVAFAAGCGLWYGRNWIRHGNPFYPVSISVAGVNWFHGPVGLPGRGLHEEWFVPSTIHWLRYPFYETFRDRAQYSGENGFGPLFAAGSIATLIALPLAARRREWTLFRALLALPITTALLIFVSPFLEPRYVIQVPGLLLLALAALAEFLHRRPDPSQSGDTPPERKPSPGPIRLLHATVATAVVFSALGAAASVTPDLDRVIKKWMAKTWTPEAFYPMHYGAAGDAFNWLAGEHEPSATFTYVHCMFYAPMFGWDNRNQVVYAPTTEDLPIGKAPRIGTYNEWRDFLQKEHVAYVVVWVSWWSEPKPNMNENWVLQHPEEFALVRDFGGRARVYRFAPVSGAASAAAASSLGEREAGK